MCRVYEAKRYEGRLIKGGMLLSVHADDAEWTARAKTILEETGAEDIASTDETKGDYANTDQPATRFAGRETDAPEERRRSRDAAIAHAVPIEWACSRA